ncbi:MAG: hypothetical protein ABIF10_03480 [Candidatus Woesearchaeota archaeon]
MKAAAILMIFLVVMIPLHVSTVYADSQLAMRKAEGKDGFGTGGEAYRRGEDLLTIEVTALVEGDTQLTADQVRIYAGGAEIPFDSCSGQACTYTEEGYSSGSYDYQVRLYDDSGNALRALDLVVVTDRGKAQVSSLAIVPTISSDGRVKLQYRAQDYGSSQSDTRYCVGVQKIEFYKGDLAGQLIQTVSVDEPFQCTVQGEEEYQDTATSGQVRICAKATDYFGQSLGSSCAQFDVDRTAPQARKSMLLRSDNRKPLRYIASQPVEAVFVMNISGTDILGDTVLADLSMLSDYISYSNVSPSRMYVSGSNTIMEWDTTVHLDKTKTAIIRVYGQDKAGNSITPSSASVQIQYDTTGPKATGLNTASGTNTIGGTIRILATMQENPGNLENANIYLDMTGLGLGIEKADSCTGSYVCEWNRTINVGNAVSATLTITTESTDDLGNRMQDTFAADLTTDTAAPRIRKIVVAPVHGEMEVPGVNYTARGDRLTIYANISDASAVTAKADLSAAVTGASNELGDCQETESGWECMWNTDSITTKGPKNVPLKFMFQDALGNVLQNTTSLYISGVINGTADYWTHNVTCSPRLVDRQITTLAEQKVYCRVRLEPLVSGISTASFDFDPAGCIGVNDSMKYVKKVTMLNSFRNSTDVYFRWQLKTTEMKVNELTTYCLLKVYTVANNNKGSYVIANPDILNVTTTIQFYNNPLGDYADSVDSLIEGVKNDVTVKMQWISDFRKYMQMGQTICSFLSMLNKVVAIYNMFVAVLAAAEKGVWYIKPARYSQQATTQILDYSKEGMIAKTYEVCAWVSCDRFIFDKLYKEFQEYINNLLSSIQGLQVMPHLAQGTGYGSLWPATPRDSLILSLGFGCIPGIIDGLEKWRQIQCNYGVCLRDSVKNGIPIKVCEDQKEYLECKYLSGEIFQILPYATSFKNMLGTAAGLLSDPWVLAFGINTAVFCYLIFEPPHSHIMCIIGKVIKELMRLFQDVENASNSWKNSFKPANDMCAMLLEE